MDHTVLGNRLVIALISIVLGGLLTILTQHILNKRGLFTYFVSHTQLGVSAEDTIFGTVRVTWNDNPIARLYSSTVELRNESLQDFDNVIVRVFSENTALLTERTEIVGTTRILGWSEEFLRQILVPAGAEPTLEQRTLFASRREYLIPTMNRNQVVRLTFLNAAGPERQPSVWLDILHKGVRTKFHVAQKQFLGVPQPSAGLVGGALGVVFLALVVALIETVWVAALAAFAFGYLALLPGALWIKLWRWIRDSIGD